MTHLSIRLLGSFQVEAADNPLPQFASDRVRVLLAYLVTEADQPHRRDKLAGLFWPNSPQKTARTNLRRTLADLRKAINDHQASPPYLLITRQSIQFNSGSQAWVDVAAFSSLPTIKSTNPPVNQQIVQQIEDTVARYRGHFLDGFFVNDCMAFEEWALLKREYFQRQILILLRCLVAYYDTMGEYDRALCFARQQIDIDPFQEQPHQQVMRLLALTGQRAAALAQYETLKYLLDKEMCMAPAAKTSALHQKILVGDLDMAEAATPSVRGYELQEQIGLGHHGVVFRAVQTGVNREVAVKVIQPQYANQPDFIRRFEAEAQLIARLEHPYIVPLYDYWREEDGAFLVMRWLRGGSLQSKLANGRLALKTAVTIIEQIASALTIAHKQHIVHRDIKPANILLDEEGNAYLTDFGIAQDSKREIDKGSFDTTLYSTTAVSPELILNEPVTPLTDVYSLGLVLYEMLTGCHPFAGLSLADVIAYCLDKPIPFVHESRSDLPPAIDDVIQRATARNPNGRFPDAISFASAFGYAAKTNGKSHIPAITTPIKATISNPYRGLQAFEEADANLFYGRVQFTEQLLSHLSSTRFLAVIGPSGCGKSSVVKAGLIPALRKGRIPGSENWFVVEMKPGFQPFAELATALRPVAVNPPPSLLEPLQKDKQGLLRVLRRILPDNQHGERSQVVLFIDQFEELFTQVEDKTIQQLFLDNLLTAIQDPLSQLRVVVTLRADFYDQPLQYPPLGELLRQHSELALPLTPSEIEEAIIKPPATVGVHLDTQLTAAIMADVQEQPGALPLLQYALTELFDHRQNNTMILSAYQEIGGIAGALSRRAEEIYDAQDNKGKAATRQLFMRLITLGEEENQRHELPVTRRRGYQSELFALQTSGEFEKADIEAVIAEYGRFRLLTFDRNPLTREPTVEVAHEALLREWPRLRAWLEKSKSDIRQQQLLASAAFEWLKAEQNEGYLLQDARLIHFSAWANQNRVALTQQEQAFLRASQTASQKQQAAEEARQQKELETAQQLAQTERQRAEEQSRANRRLRWQAVFLAGALLIAAVLAVLADNASRRANENALAAQTSANIASTREADALVEAEQRATAEFVAIQEREEAQSQERQAQARALAGAAKNNIQVDPELSVLLALQAVETTYQQDGTWVPEAVDALHDSIQSISRLQLVWHNPGGAMNGIIYSADGAYLGTSTLLADQDIMTTVWDVETGQILFHLPTSIASFSQDNQRLMTWGATASNLAWDIWDVATAEKMQTINVFVPDLNTTTGGALSLDWQYMALRYEDNRATIWDMTSKEKLLELTGHSDMVNSVEFSPDNRYVATAGLDGLFKVWPMPTNNDDAPQEPESLITFEHADSIEAFAFSADSNYVATASRDQTAVIWNLKASLAEGFPVAETTISLAAHKEPIKQITFNEDGSLLAAASQDGVINIWHTQTGQLYLTFISNDLTRSIAFSPDGTHLLAANDAGLIQTWDIAPTGGKEWLTLTGHDGAVNRAIYSPDGSQIVTVSSDGTIKIWNATSGDLKRTIAGHSDQVRAVTFCPDGSCLVTASNDRLVKFWDIDTGRELSSIDAYRHLPINPIPENNVLDLVFTANGSRLLSVGMDNEPDMWDVGTKKHIMSLVGHDYNVVSAADSPDGQSVATIGPDGMMIIWDSQTGEQRFIQQTTEYGSKDVAFSPDGNRLATADNDGAVRVWDLQAQAGERLLLTLSGHGSSVQSVAFSPNGRYIISAGSNLIWVWDAETGQPLYSLPGHTKVVLDIAFSPDGKHLVSASADGTVRIYVLPIEDLMTLARSRLTRALTPTECQRYLHREACVETP